MLLSAILWCSGSATAQPAPAAEPTTEPTPAEAPVDDVAPAADPGEVDEEPAAEPAEDTGAPPAGDQAVEDPDTTGAAIGAAPARPAPAPAQFLAGNDVDIDSAKGDVLAMANSVRVVNEIGDNAVLMGRQVTVRAPTAGDVLAMGQIIKIDAPIGGDLYALGAELQITEDGSVGGTILGTAQRIVVEGTIAGDVSLRSELLELDGAVEGDASLTFGQLELGDEARIDGDLNYIAPHTSEALVGITAGESSYSLSAEDAEDAAETGVMATLQRLARGSLRVVGSYLAQLLVGVVMLLLLGDFARRPARTIAEQPLISLVLGGAVLVAIPVLTILTGFVFTVLWRDVDLLSGMIAAATPPLGAAAVTVWGFGFIVGRILTALTLGDLLLGRIAPGRKDQPTAALAAGLVPLVLLSAVPWLDYAVWGVATALGLGGTWLYIRMVSKQPE